MRIFLDANILFSAAKTDGAIRQMLRLIADAGHECWVDGFVVEEAHRNLIAKAPALVTGDKTHFARLFGKTIHGVAVYSPRSLAEAMLDPGRARGNDSAHARVAKYRATQRGLSRAANS